MSLLPAGTCMIALVLVDFETFCWTDAGMGRTWLDLARSQTVSHGCSISHRCVCVETAKLVGKNLPSRLAPSFGEWDALPHVPLAGMWPCFPHISPTVWHDCQHNEAFFRWHPSRTQLTAYLIQKSSSRCIVVIWTIARQFKTNSNPIAAF